MQRKILIICFLLLAQWLWAWDWWPLPMACPDNERDTFYYELGVAALTSSGAYAPYWLTTNTHAAVSVSPHSGNFTMGITKNATRPHRWWDYDFACTASARVQTPIQHTPDRQQRTYWYAYTNRLYAHLRLYIVDISAGIRPIECPLGDPLLSTGHMAFSPNAHPMPGFTIGIEQWTAFPGLYGYVEIQGAISQLWQVDNVYVRKGKVHYKYAGIRFLGRLPVNISYRLDHICQWGGYSPVYGDLGNDFSSFFNAFRAGAGGSMPNDQLNAQGNHIGAQTLNVEGKIPLPNQKDLHLQLYWQTLFEDASAHFIGAGTNLPDGVFGLNIAQNAWPFIQSATIEYVGTTDQTGPYHDRDGLIFAGRDNYYQNSIYRNGWNYYYRTLGNPFITSPVYNTDETAIATLNNRAKVWHFGLRGDIYGFRYRAMISYARNYGTYQTQDSYKLQSHNTALLLEVERKVTQAWDLCFGIRFAGDIGTQFGNNFGAQIYVYKQGIIPRKSH